MERIHYPLLVFEFDKHHTLGILVGTGYQVMGKDVKGVRMEMLSYLQKQYKKYDDYPYMDVQDPRLKIVQVPIRPAYKESTSSYPMSYTLSVPIPIVYGETENGHYECFLPLFDESFYYYEAKQFDALVQHFCLNLLNQKKPEKIFKLMRYPKPKMDFLTLKVNYDRKYDGWIEFNSQRQFRALNRLTEQYPLPKYIKKKLSNYPEVAWELEDKVTEVIDKLINTRSNVILVGKHGVGKSAVLQQAIKKITTQNKNLQMNFTFWRIRSQRIFASTKYLGEWEEACEELIDELIAANGILWVVDIVQMLQSGGQGPEDSIAAFFTAYLQQGKLQLVGEATPEELESMRRLLPGFVEHFQVVRLEKLPYNKIQNILQKFADFIYQKHKIKIEDRAIQQAYRLLFRYYPYESFPGKGIKFLGQCVTDAQLKQRTTVSFSHVINNFIEQTGLPELFLRDDLILNQAELKEHFHRQIIGQPEAISKLTSVVKIYKAGLNNPNKPISTMLFTGPTGVGKTASAKTLADYFFGKGQKKSPLIRIDMSEFQHPGQIYRFIGTGREVGQLTKEVRERPFSVLLLDEIEKADPSIFDVLLGILDEGKLVDNYGRVTNFRNTIIILTSNLGASNQTAVGYMPDENEHTRYTSAIERHFRPEFVNRLDNIVFFRSLSQQDIRKITYKELEELKQREGFVKRGLQLEFSEKTIRHITEVGFDHRYGARPLQRAIEQSLVTPMANWLLEHPEVTNTILIVDFEGEVRIDTMNGRR